MFRNLFSFIVISQLIIAPAYSGTSESAPSNFEAPVNIQVSIGLPNQGYLDSYHDTKTVKSDDYEQQMEFSLYALRNIVVMKLLKTRMALKEIIGDENSLNLITSREDNKRQGFSVPQSVKNLYQGEVEILDFSEDINWLEGIDNSNQRNFSQPNDIELRRDLYLGLISVSIQVTKFDNFLKFLRKDLWPMAFKDKVARKFLKSKYTKEYNLRDLEIQLQGQRDALLYRYHMLNLEVKKEPLYKRIYTILEKDFFFPAADMIQRPSGIIFDPTRSMIDLPTSMEERINIATTDMLNNDSTQEDVFKEVQPLIESALVLSLENNYKALEDVTKPIHYSDDKDIFRFLARDESLWSETQNNYYYLKDKINFSQGLSKAYGLNFLSDLKRETLKRVGMQAGITLAIASAIFTGGASLAGAGTIAGVSASTTAAISTAATVTGALSTVILIGDSSYNYYEASKYAEWSRNLFIGSKDISSNEEMKNYALIEKSEFSSLIFSLMMAGAPSLITRGFSAARVLALKGGKELVKLEIKELQAIQQVYEKYSPRLKKLGNLGQTLLKKHANTFIKLTGQTERMQRVENLIAQSAQKLGMTFEKAKAILMSYPKSKAVLEWYAGKTAANPLFMSQLLREVGLGFIMSVSTEAMIRGDMFWDEIDYVIVNSLVGIIVISTLMIKSTASKENPKMMFNVLFDQRSGIFSEGLSAAARGRVLAESGKLFLKPAIELATISAGTSFVISGGSELINHYRHPGKEEVSDRIKRVFETSLYYGLFVGVISNLKSQAINGWMEPKIAANIGKRALANKGVLNPSYEEIIAFAKTSKLHNGVMSSISLTDSFVEDYFFTLGIRSLGIQENEPLIPKETDMPYYFRIVENSHHSKYLYDFL